jgi:hypothetical protein
MFSSAIIIPAVLAMLDAPNTNIRVENAEVGPLVFTADVAPFDVEGPNIVDDF